MKKRLLLTVTLILCSAHFLFSQEQNPEDDNIDWSKKLIKEVKLENPVYKPIIGGGFGTFTFYGEVKNKYFKEFTHGNAGFNLDIYRALDPSFKVGFRFLYGKLTSNHQDVHPKKNFNFQSQIMGFGTNLMYNITSLNMFPKKENRVLVPYVSLGFEFINFESYGDLKNSQGKTYHYWDDGSIRDVAEFDNEGKRYSGKSVVLTRDNNYETSYKEQNIDGIETTSPITLAIPAEIGLEFVISQKSSFKVGYAYHYTLTDQIDNISTKGTKYKDYPEREGKKGFDAFSYSYLQFSLDLFSKTTEEQQLQFLDLGAGGVFDFWDMDNDYVMDLYDKCPWTPRGVLVDSVGCPQDSDNDRIPDHIDKEKNTPQGAFYVNADGKEMTKDEILALLNDRDAVNQDEIYRYYPSLLDGTGLHGRFSKMIPQKFKSVDSNSDGYISLDEYLKSIDTFFDSGTQMSVEDLYELNEFFFIQ